MMLIVAIVSVGSGSEVTKLFLSAIQFPSMAESPANPTTFNEETPPEPFASCKRVRNRVPAIRCKAVVSAVMFPLFCIPMAMGGCSSGKI